MPETQSSRSGRSRDGMGGFLVLVCATVALVVAPALVVLWKVGGEILSPGPTPDASPLVPWRLLGTTFLYSGGVSLGATLLAIPAALVVRAKGWRWGVWACTPLLLPSYLAYSGWGLLRAPRTVLGDAIERAASAGALWLPTVVGETLAVGGLVLWSWPIAAVLLSVYWSRVDTGAFDALVLDSKGLRRCWSIGWMCAPGLLAAFVATMLVMLGSPVPFHLSQVPTVSIEVWRRLTEESTPARAWASALPLTAIVIVTVLLFSRTIFDGSPLVLESHEASTTVRNRRTTSVAVGVLVVVLLCSVVVPLALFLLEIHHWQAVRVTLHSLRPSIVNSAGVCLLVTLFGLVIALASWSAFSSLSNTIRAGAQVCLLCFLITGALPGVLVGSAIAALITLVDLHRCIADSSAAVAIGHLARFSFVPMLVGWWLARTEPADARDVRRTEGSSGLFGYVVGVLPTQLPALIGASAILAALSLHEIESAIMLTPPGGGGLAHRILQFLHYSKMEDLSVASAGLAISAIALAAIVGFTGGRRSLPPTVEPPSSGQSVQI